MAERRMIWRDLSGSEKAAEVLADKKHGEMALLLYCLAIPWTDDFGNYPADKTRLAKLFPVLTRPLTDLEAARDLLFKVGLWARYEALGGAYLHVYSHNRHQTGLRRRTHTWPPHPVALNQHDVENRDIDTKNDDSAPQCAAPPVRAPHVGAPPTEVNRSELNRTERNGTEEKKNNSAVGTSEDVPTEGNDDLTDEEKIIQTLANVGVQVGNLPAEQKKISAALRIPGVTVKKILDLIEEKKGQFTRWGYIETILNSQAAVGDGDADFDRVLAEARAKAQAQGAYHAR